MADQSVRYTLVRDVQTEVVVNPADRTRELAQAKVDRESRRLDAESAAAEYAAKRASLSDNIARQRQERLAREAAEGVGDAKPAARIAAPKKKIRRVGVSR